MSVVSDAVVDPMLSAARLGHFLECEHRISLELGVLAGKLQRPGMSEVQQELLEKRGVDHEQRVLEHYLAAGAQVVQITVRPDAAGRAEAAAETLAAMQAGADVIYQGTLVEGSWTGRPDFLVKVAEAGGAGARFPHHYEVVEAKLSREARASAVLQLCVYTERLAALQGVMPERFHVAGGGVGAAPLALRVADYMAYYRAVRARYGGFCSEGGAASYPEPVEHCGVCPWWRRCEEQRRADDHLSLVAGITRRQRDRLALNGVSSLGALAELPAEASVEGVAEESLERLREQAGLQRQAAVTGEHRYRLLRDADRQQARAQGAASARRFGLEALPAPTPGDLFLDIEGDAFVGGVGLDYLLGWLELGQPSFDFSARTLAGEPRHHAEWARDRASEKRAFEAVIDRIVSGLSEFRALHVYHFGHRESDALKKLSCRHKTREDVVDQLLREHVLVDLYPIVRQSLRASVEGYTLKQLEVLHGFKRQTDLREAARAMQHFGYWLETGAMRLRPEELEATIEAYNREDCLSTWKLRDFLESKRLELERLEGQALARPAAEAPPAAEERKHKNQAMQALAERLLEGINDPEERSARQLVGDLLDWHWREAKSSWWEYFRARDLPPAERLEDRAVLAELTYAGEVAKVKRSTVHCYSFPAQEHGVRATPGPIDPDSEKAAGEVVELGEAYIHLKRQTSSKVPHPRALIPGKPIATDTHEAALLELGQAIASDDAGARSWPAARHLLARRPPSVGQAPGAPLVRAGEPIESELERVGLALDGGVLAVQGPPGSGKTYQASRLILALLRAGKRVGVTANSHSVIRELLNRVVAEDAAIAGCTLHVHDDADSAPPAYEMSADKPRVVERLRAGALKLVGGTTWTWTRGDFAGSVDALVVDEAGQMSLANVLAASRATSSLILVGDPAQLEQPQKGVHPPGADVSALEHLLGGDALTIPEHLGVFLPDTRRLHPRICEFVSSVFYEGRLEAVPGLERQTIAGPGVLSGAGLRYVPVDHVGNTNQSDEEVAEIARLLGGLEAAGASFVDRRGERRPLALERDVLVVTPYNAQVAALKRRLPAGIAVGTVDKFQGREAPIVFYSMASSSGEDAPKGIEFLYSLNRLNVAISRAQALAVLVASPRLTRAACKTPRQMKLVNALCAYLEGAREIFPLPA